MNNNKKQMLAAFIKKERLAKGYTQKELAEYSNISIRSIQRIENGALIPRSYTLKTIAQVLGTPFESIAAIIQEDEKTLIQNDITNTIRYRIQNITTAQRILLSICLPVLVFLLTLAYLAQSTHFPETTFEAILLWVGNLLVISFLLFLLWSPKN